MFTRAIFDFSRGYPHLRIPGAEVQCARARCAIDGFGGCVSVSDSAKQGGCFLIF